MTTAAPITAPPPTGKPAGPAPRPRSGTPRLLSQLRLAAVITMLALGIAASWLVVQARFDLTQAATHVDQYARATGIEADLLRADAEATAAFIAPQGGTASYQSYLESAADKLVNLAATDASHTTEIVTAQQKLTTYIRTMETAQALRAVDPATASTKLADATSYLRTDVLPALATVAAASSADATTHLTVRATGWIVPIALVAVLLLVLISVPLALRTHRSVNLGMALAIVSVAAMWFVANSSIGSLTTNGSEAAIPELTRMSQAAQARIDLALARDDELHAIAIPAKASAYNDSADAALASVDGTKSILTSQIAGYRTAVDAYEAAAAQVRQTVSTGDTVSAAGEALSAGGSLTQYDAADKLLADYVKSTNDQVTETLRGNDARLYLAAAALLLIALFGMGAASWGVTQRLKEYR